MSSFDKFHVLLSINTVSFHLFGPPSVSGPPNNPCFLSIPGLTDNCASGPCLNGGACQETPDGFTCDCPTYPQAFIGPDCGQVYDACAVYECPRTYNCSNVEGNSYMCLCQPGSNCSNGCESDPCVHPNSTCRNFMDGFICQSQDGCGGPNCQPNVPCSPNLCQNNASCVAHANSYTCVCEPGYTGQHCEVNIDECQSSPCQNDAICVDKVNKYVCFCVPGFQGYHCEIDINECASRPCLNNGTCTNLQDMYECHCAIGYTGVNCETDIDECESNPCQNGARCRDHIGYYSCDCQAGYDGERCQYDIDECQSQPCQNGGQCQDAINRYQCNCSDTGFVGDMCEIDIPECASNPCMNNATCLEGVKTYSCLCWPGYSGDHCEVDDNECSEFPCENDGVCLERSIQSFYGAQPEFPHDFCYSRAAGYVCRCLPGFTGENCSVNINECESEPCQNGGLCRDMNNGFLCDCALGYTGYVCAINIDDCENNPCENGATCQDGIANYLCLCPATAPDGTTWGGKNCSVKLVGCLGHRCQNEATCIPTYEGEVHSYVCQCQPGFYGENCSTPTTFSFSSTGYFVYDLSVSNRSRRSVEEVTTRMAVRFRTTLPDMVIAYRGDEDTFLLLEIYKGLLYARFRSNGSTIHLHIADHRIDDGHWHKAEVTLRPSLELILHHADCTTGFCSVTKFLSMDNDLQLPESFSTVYIGGLTQASLLNNIWSLQNFTGCLEDMEIDSRMLLPQNFGGNRSIEMELGCNKTEWCHPNPCENRALCIDRWINFKCECIRPYKGPTCLHEYTSATFHLEGAPSFASFTVPQDLGNTFTISGFIRTLKSTGLLLLISSGTTDYFRVYLQNGRVHVTTLSALPIVFQEHISDGQKHRMDISVSQGLVTVTYLQEEVKLGQLPPMFVTEGDIVYIGGVPSGGNADSWGGYFKGCLQDLRLNDHHLEFFPLEMEEISVQEGYYLGNSTNVTRDCVSDDVCQTGPCKNSGTCSVTWNDFTCSCPANYTGRTCEEPVWCERRPCPAETTCRDVPGGYVCLANATFQGNSSVIFTPKVATSRDITSISLEFRTRERDAVLLQASKDVDSILIAIQEGVLVITLQSGNSVDGLRFKSPSEVSDALWHRVVMTMGDAPEATSRWTVHLDKVLNVTILGSARSLSFLGEDVPIVLAENYTGCLGEVTIGGLYLPFTDLVFPQQEQFIKSSSRSLDLGCRGKDICSTIPCLHGGDCLDLFNAFYCRCKGGWEGTLCQSNIDDCMSSPCINGSCLDLEADYQCSCFPGYTGRNCETNIDDCVHHQCLNGGSCEDGVNSYTCVCPATYAGPHCQWPYPPDQCDKNFSCLNGGRCMSGLWGANCTCRSGFTGKRCEVNINDCESNPCLNGGTCQDSVNTFKCICNASYSGVRCEKPRLLRVPKASTLVGSAIGTGMLFILLSVIAAVVVTMRKKRATQGTYSPSRQEKDGARVEMWNVLKLPPTERLI
ncbi:protein crumbs homolog 2 [Discoglossus pictus]